ncbi:hypothetical protein [Ekhidna sp.]
MAGICWFVQVVHYPLFLQISDGDFPAYEKKNYRTAYLTVTLMVIELLSGSFLLFWMSGTLFFYNMLLLFVIEISTILFQIPIQIGLSRKSSSAQKLRLIQTNWIRTILWTLRSMILLKITYDLLPNSAVFKSDTKSIMFLHSNFNLCSVYF